MRRRVRSEEVEEYGRPQTTYVLDCEHAPDLSGIRETGKGQGVRLFDVFLLGPLMTWAGLALRPQNRLAGWALFTSGVLTVGFNAINYLRVQGGEHIE